ncbi:hypothetical protein MBM_03075 [Drepanopeziza brunnea f. sp. 'multigermtubi' MB_m1]|uniref:Uncharacterized protein n=1 Tax=Marssonina brunnea f. sp. multigermtubi (strain MB_m1) TaxID=1072389 RepID=K1XDA7_MARBU|nr:uncharacterized protein MBM_03075 [Drepanopeziza brunnea f. sp. 'multigermtubi' MB_m1]EKD18833.1 hypothetical protein MBM_03075 [Drepanopeziza brunnea f. sp. 'multigermtubi' MB_m1]
MEKAEVIIVEATIRKILTAETITEEVKKEVEEKVEEEVEEEEEEEEEVEKEAEYYCKQKEHREDPTRVLRDYVKAFKKLLAKLYTRISDR